MTYKELIVWQKADELAIGIYRATRSFPKEEIYGLTSQITEYVNDFETPFVRI